MNTRLRILLGGQLPRHAVVSRRAFSASFPSRSYSAEDSQNTDINEVEDTRSRVAKSSVPAGTVLRGLNTLKTGSDPVALEDSEYPDWLWEVLTPRASASGIAPDQYIDPNLTKKQRKRELKRMAKETAATTGREIKIPIHQQTTDLPVADGQPEAALEAGAARDTLRQALRQQRRAKIKETNFLKTMS